MGEITNYLTDGLNAFIAEPGNINSLISKLKVVLNDYDAAIKIGRNGKKVVSEHFNYIIQTKHIKEFIKSLEISA